MAIFDSIDQTIGNTPLLKLNNIMKKYDLKANIFAKLEFFNPAGSIKDRVAKSIIEDAISKGLINKDTTIIEPTSGNTGIGLASICAARGYKLILTMPSTMSVERRKILKAYGAELILTDGAKGMAGAVEKAQEIHEKTENSFIAGQFVNKANPKAHIETTAPEIYEELQENIACVVAGVGTGGTITGIGEYLKEKIPTIKVVAVEPESSPLLSKGIAGAHKIQGIGANFIPEVLNRNIIDQVVTIKNEDAIFVAKEIGVTEGFLVGISSGAALKAAIEIAKNTSYFGKNIVVVFPDTGDRYISTELFE